MSEKLKVRLTATQKIRYDQTVEMTAEQWAKFKATDERTHIVHGGDLSGWLDLTQEDDYGDLDDFEAEVIDENGKVIDSYEG